MKAQTSIQPTTDNHSSSQNEEGRHSTAIETLESLSGEQIEQLSLHEPKALDHYVKVQRKWIEDSQYFLGIDLGHSPNPFELADKILTTNDPKRFRCYYALCYPENIKSVSG